MWKRIVSVSILSVLLGGCVGQFQTVKTSADYDKVYDATRQTLQKYFDIAYENKDSGVICTSYALKKTEDGVVKLRAIATVDKNADSGNAVHLKVIRERNVEEWDLLGLTCREKQKWEGTDDYLASRILSQIESLVGSVKAGKTEAKKEETKATPSPGEKKAKGKAAERQTSGEQKEKAKQETMGGKKKEATKGTDSK